MRSIITFIFFIILTSFHFKKSLQLITIQQGYPELYFGIDNPISIEAYGISNDMIKISCQNGKMKRVSKSEYLIQPTVESGQVIIKASYGQKSIEKTFYIKTLPFPRPTIGKDESQSIFKPVTFKNSQGLRLPILNTGIDANCTCLSYSIIRVSKNGQYENAFNHGGKYRDAALKLIQQAQSGDIYIFDNIEYRCFSSSKKLHWAEKVAYIK